MAWAGLIMIPLPPYSPFPPLPFRILLGVVLALLLGSFMVVLEVVLEVVSDVVLE